MYAIKSASQRTIRKRTESRNTHLGYQSHQAKTFYLLLLLFHAQYLPMSQLSTPRVSFQTQKMLVNYVAEACFHFSEHKDQLPVPRISIKPGTEKNSTARSNHSRGEQVKLPQTHLAAHLCRSFPEAGNFQQAGGHPSGCPSLVT